MSNIDYKQKFINYCKDKKASLGRIEITDDLSEEVISYPIIMLADYIRNFSNCKVVLNDENDNFIVVDESNKIVIDTNMVGPDQFAGDLTFTKIDRDFYNYVIENWDELYISEYMEKID